MSCQLSQDDLRMLRSCGAIKAYQTQKHHAVRRGVDFHLTLEEWWAVWSFSGHFSERGRGAYRYCMSRHGDVGPYAVGNVFIQTNAQNVSEFRKRFVSEGRQRLSRSRIGTGRGWGFYPERSRSKPYLVQVAGTKPTSHATQAEAEAEYQRRSAAVLAEREMERAAVVHDQASH